MASFRAKASTLRRPIPRKPGYYGQPRGQTAGLDVASSLYFFMGGIAGMSAVIAWPRWFHHVDPSLATMSECAYGHVGRGHRLTILSPILLIMDLGRPHLFLNMLRVFKHRSAMSMGAWILSAFVRVSFQA